MRREGAWGRGKGQGKKRGAKVNTNNGASFVRVWSLEASIGRTCEQE
jgi:hypothetical protein